MGRYADYDRDDCEEETEKQVTRTRVVVARKARGSIKPGDLVEITDGFTYEVGGARTGYLRRCAMVLASADGTVVNEYLAERVLKHHGRRLSAVQRAAVETVVASKAEKARIAREKAEAARREYVDLMRVLRGAKYGDRLTYRDRDCVFVEHAQLRVASFYEDVDLTYTTNIARIRDVATHEVIAIHT